ncbi:hypothetical protein ACOMHN_034528 [Nucella lapillus]
MATSLVLWLSVGLLLAVNVLEISGTGCQYEGRNYQQGQTWSKPCQVNCRCDNAATGHYTCTDVCLTYTNLPPGCTLVKPPGEPCCGKPQCTFPTASGGIVGTGTGGGVVQVGTGTMTSGGSTTQCVDKIPSCKDYGTTVCSDPKYAQWVADNCVATCGRSTAAILDSDNT